LEFNRVLGFEVSRKFYPSLKNTSQNVLNVQTKNASVITSAMIQADKPQTEQRKECK